MADGAYTVEQLKQGARNARDAGDLPAAKRLIDRARALEAQQTAPPPAEAPAPADTVTTETTQEAAPAPAPAQLPQTPPPAVPETEAAPVTNIPPIDVEPVVEDERSLFNRSMRRAGQDILAAPGVVALPRMAIAGAQKVLGINDTFAEGLLDDEGNLRPTVQMAADLYEWAGEKVDAQDAEDGSVPLDEELGGLGLGTLLTLPILPARIAGLGAKGASLGARTANVAFKALETATPVTLVGKNATRGEIAANILANQVVGGAITEGARYLGGEQTLTQTVLGLDEDGQAGAPKSELGAEHVAGAALATAAVSVALGRGGSRARKQLDELAGGAADDATELGPLPTTSAKGAARQAEAELVDEDVSMVEAVRATAGDEAAERADDFIKSHRGDTVDNQIERMVSLGTLSRDGSISLNRPLSVMLKDISSLGTQDRKTLNEVANALNELSNRRRGLPPTTPQTKQRLEWIRDRGLENPAIRKLIDEADDNNRKITEFLFDEGMIDAEQRQRQLTRGFYMPQIDVDIDPSLSGYDKFVQQTKRMLWGEERSGQDALNLALNGRLQRRTGGMQQYKDFTEAMPEYMSSIIKATNDNKIRVHIADTVADRRVMRRGRNVALMRQVREGAEETPAQVKKREARHAKQMEAYNKEYAEYERLMANYRRDKATWLKNRDLRADRMRGVKHAEAMGDPAEVRKAKQRVPNKMKQPKEPPMPKMPERPKAPTRPPSRPGPGQIQVRKNGKTITYDVGDRRLLHGLQGHPRLTIPVANVMRKFYQQFTTGYMNPTFAPMTAVYDITMAALGLNVRKQVSGHVDAALKRNGVPDSVRNMLALPVRVADLPITYMEGVFQNLYGKRLLIEAERLATVAAETGHPMDKAAALAASKKFMTSMYGTMHRHSRAGGMFSEELDDLAAAQNFFDKMRDQASEGNNLAALGNAVKGTAQALDPSRLRFTKYGRAIDSIRDGMSMGIFARNYAEEAIGLQQQVSGKIDKLADKEIQRIARASREALADPQRKPKNDTLNRVLATIPYSNVIVQSLAHVTHHMLTNRSAQSTVMSVIGIRMAATAMMTPEQRMEYEREMPEWKRIMYMPLPWGDGPEDFMYLPLGHELGTLSAVGAEVAQGMIDADSDLRVIGTGERTRNALLDLVGFAVPPAAGAIYAGLTGQQLNPSAMVREGLVPDERNTYGIPDQRGIGQADGWIGDRLASIIQHATGTTGTVVLRTLEPLLDHDAGALSSDAWDEAMDVAKYEVGRQPVVRTIGSLFGASVTDPGSRASPLSDAAYRVDRSLRAASKFINGVDPDMGQPLDADFESNPYQQLPQKVTDPVLVSQAQWVADYFSSSEHRKVLGEISQIHEAYRRTQGSGKGTRNQVAAAQKELNDRLNERYNELLANYADFEDFMQEQYGDDWTIDRFTDAAVQDARNPSQ